MNLGKIIIAETGEKEITAAQNRVGSHGFTETGRLRHAGMAYDEHILTFGPIEGIGIDVLHEHLVQLIETIDVTGVKSEIDQRLVGTEIDLFLPVITLKGKA